MGARLWLRPIGDTLCTWDSPVRLDYIQCTGLMGTWSIKWKRLRCNRWALRLNQRVNFPLKIFKIWLSTVKQGDNILGSVRPSVRPSISQRSHGWTVFNSNIITDYCCITTQTVMLIWHIISGCFIHKRLQAVLLVTRINTKQLQCRLSYLYHLLWK